MYEQHVLGEISKAPSVGESAGTVPPKVRERFTTPRPVDIERDRRRLIWACVGGYLGINFLMFLRFFFSRALYEPNATVNIGLLSSFQKGVNQQFFQSKLIWVILERDRLLVIGARCTYLGCTPDWLPQKNMFQCPGHGSESDPEGINFAGSAPRPADRCYVTLLGQRGQRGRYQPADHPGSPTRVSTISTTSRRT
jgi:cytochrome b6-f complex iron-sulfur subunit